MNSDRIWGFWEPSGKIPGYLQLCLGTWDSLGRDIIILDDKNIDSYLSKKETKILRENKHNYSLPQYADAVRVMILRRYGGIWMDLDTIIVNIKEFKKIEKLKTKTDLLLIDNHIGWIWASKKSRIMREWYRELMLKLNPDKFKTRRYGLLSKLKRAFLLAKFMLFNEPSKIQALSNNINTLEIDWDYLGNSILNRFLESAEAKDYISVTSIFPYETIVPESVAWEENEKDPIGKYRDFYFSGKDNTRNIKQSALISLHNSWTPEKYKKMGKTEFLKTHNTLSGVISNAISQK